MLRITIDTNVFILATDEEHPGHPEREPSRRLLERADVEIAVAGALDRELPTDPARRAKRLAALERFDRLEAAPFRLDVSVLDGPDELAGDEVATAADEIEQALWPEGLGDESTQPRNLRRRASDVDHIAAHWRSGRDVFVTVERHLVESVPLRRLGIDVAPPSAVLQRLE